MNLLIWAIMTSKQFESFYNQIIPKTEFCCNSIEEFRGKVELFMEGYPLPPDIRTEPISIGDLSACWFFSPEAKKKKIILFFHGGGYSVGSIKSCQNLCARLSMVSNAAVLSVGYRLAPENPYPAALEDALSAYRWLLHHPYPRSHIAFAGISAGAGLALALLLKLKIEKIAMPAGALCFCPWVDLSTIPVDSSVKDIICAKEIQSATQQYIGSNDSKNPLISPLYGNLKGLPPLFIQTGSRDLLHEQAVKLAEKAKREGVEITFDSQPDMIHNWPLFAPEFPEAQHAIMKAGKFLEKLF